jgi:hypothetical protein
MSQVLVMLATWVSEIPDAAKSAVFIMCEFVVATIVLSPFLFRGTSEPTARAIEEPRPAGSKGLIQ